MRRYTLNSIGVLFILAVAILAVNFYARPKFSLEKLELPQVDNVSILDVDVNSESDTVTVVVVFDPSLVSGDQTVPDFLAIYDWGAQQIEEGGAVEIVLITKGAREIPLVNGSGTIYFILMESSLEKSQIDLLQRQLPVTLRQYVNIHEQVARSTGGAGGNIVIHDTPIVYYGIDH